LVNEPGLGGDEIGAIEYMTRWERDLDDELCWDPFGSLSEKLTHVRGFRGTVTTDLDMETYRNPHPDSKERRLVR
jgi:hypothetical protein